MIFWIFHTGKKHKLGEARFEGSPQRVEMRTFFLVFLDTLNYKMVKEIVCPSPLLGPAFFWQYSPGLIRYTTYVIMTSLRAARVAILQECYTTFTRII